jgi:hypothetical protein
MLGEVCPVVVSKYRFQPVEGPSNGGPNYEALKVERCLTAQEIVTLRASWGKQGLLKNRI